MIGKTVILHCNAGPPYGLGHLMRCTGLAEEAVERGWRVVVGGRIDPVGCAYLGQYVPAADVVDVPTADAGQWLATAAAMYGANVVHADSYLLDDLPAGGWVTSNMQDGEFGYRVADVMIDPNIGAEERFVAPAVRAETLLGLPYFPVRREVRRARDDRPDAGGPVRVLVVLGGTDSSSRGPDLVDALLDEDPGLVVTLVVPGVDAAGRERLAGRRPALTVLPFVTGLPALAARHDVILSGAGSSMWDFMHLGRPLGLLCVADNQADAYRRVVAGGLAVGIGEPPYEDLREGVRRFVQMIHTPADRADLVRRGRELVDGHGAERIVRVWDKLAH